MQVYFFTIETDQPPILDLAGPQPQPLEGCSPSRYLCCSNHSIDTILAWCRNNNLEVVGFEEDVPMWRRHAFTEQTVDTALYNNKHRAACCYGEAESYALVPFHF